MPTARSPVLARSCRRPDPVRAGGYGPPPDGHSPRTPNPRHAALRTRRPRARRASRGGRSRRWRAATRLETDAGRFWLCAGAQRAEGSADDAYEFFVALHEAGRLLPDDDDRLRDALERNARIIDAAAAAIPAALADALARRGRDVEVRFGELVDARLHATASGDEIWVAIATQAVDGRFVDERLRDVLFRLVFDAAEAELWEPRADWPSGELAWFEVARLGLREPT